MYDTKTLSILSAARLGIALIGAVMAALAHHIDAGALQTLDIATGAFLVALMAAWGQWNVHQVETAAKAREVVALRVGQAIADGTAGPTPLAAASEVPALIKIIAPKLPPVDSLPDAVPNPLAGHT
jgi:hypothetical protein